MSNEEFNRMRALPRALLIKQPSKKLLAFAKRYFAETRTELRIIPTASLS